MKKIRRPSFYHFVYRNVLDDMIKRSFNLMIENGYRELDISEYQVSIMVNIRGLLSEEDITSVIVQDETLLFKSTDKTVFGWNNILDRFESACSIYDAIFFRIQDEEENDMNYHDEDYEEDEF